jgi:hypothetical protein
MRAELSTTFIRIPFAGIGGCVKNPKPDPDMTLA